MLEGTSGQISISACMMVKNEEKNLPRCLSSIHDFVTEIIVVDTGSTDKTVEIAESYGAKVYHHPWEDDFSKHRNQSISYATGDWIFIIDADEEAFIDKDLFFANLQVIPPDCEALAIHFIDIHRDQEVLEFSSIRFFRNGHIQYQGIVHNQPIIKDGSGSLVVSGFTLKHYGYDVSDEEMHQKFERTRILLEKTLEQEPDNYHTYFYLNQIYATHHMPRKAIEYGEEYIKYKDFLKNSGRMNFNTSIYYTMVKCFFNLGDDESLNKAHEWIIAGVQEINDDLDLSVVLLEYGIKRKRTDLILLGGTQFIKTYENLTKDPSIKGNRFIHNHNPTALCFVMFNMIQAHFTDGINLTHSLYSHMNKINPKFKKGLMLDLQSLYDLFEIKNPLENKSFEIPSDDELTQIINQAGATI